MDGYTKDMENVQQCIGNVIERVSFDGDSLALHFEDLSTLRMHDAAQYCCENRYMTCDDELETFSGAKLVSVEVRDITQREEHRYDVHEIKTLVITTTKGAITAFTHNVHNGYYGGFHLKAHYLRAYN